MIAFDTETYYDSHGCSVKDLGPEAYTRHPDFDSYMVSVHGEGLDYSGPPENAPWEKMNNREWCAHNAQFDGWVFRWLKKKGVVPEHIRPAGPIWDTSAIPAYNQVRRNLADAGRFMLGVVHSKRARTQMSGKKWSDVDSGLAKAMTEYALEDARICHDLWKKHAESLPTEEWELADLTVDCADHGVRVDVEKLENSRNHLLDIREELLKNIPWSDGSLKGAQSVASFKKQLLKDGVASIPKSTAAHDVEWNAFVEEHGTRLPYIQAYKDLGKLNKHFATVDSIHRRVNPDTGILHYSMKYCGAALTGRWSGGNETDTRGRNQDTSLNMQNLTKSAYFDTPIRPLFIPRENHKFIVADLSNIEPRCLATLVGDGPFLDMVREGVDIYEAHARQTMGYDDPRPLKEVDDAMRQRAKVRVLQLGYGTGWRGYQMQAHARGQELSEQAAKDVVYSYRRTNPRIVKFWDHLYAVLQQSQGGDAEIELPTGRELKYFDVRSETFMKFNRLSTGLRCTVEKGNDNRVEFWGSKLCENVVQAMARDVFAGKLIDLRRAGLQILWHVHDEVILEVHESQADDALETVIQILKQPDGRVPTLPLSCEAHIADYYDK